MEKGLGEGYYKQLVQRLRVVLFVSFFLSVGQKFLYTFHSKWYNTLRNLWDFDNLDDTVNKINLMAWIVYSILSAEYIFSLSFYHITRGFPGGSVVKSTYQCRRSSFHSWVGKIPWRRKWQPTPVLLPGKFHGQRSLASCCPWGYKIVRLDLVTEEHWRTTMYRYEILFSYD